MGYSFHFFWVGFFFFFSFELEMFLGANKPDTVQQRQKLLKLPQEAASFCTGLHRYGTLVASVPPHRQREASHQLIQSKSTND